MSGFYVEHSVGPRYIDGINIDADVTADMPKNQRELQISDPVTPLYIKEYGIGYEPGQKNLDGSDL